MAGSSTEPTTGWPGCRAAEVAAVHRCRSRGARGVLPSGRFFFGGQCHGVALTSDGPHPPAPRGPCERQEMQSLASFLEAGRGRFRLAGASQPVRDRRQHIRDEGPPGSGHSSRSCCKVHDHDAWQGNGRIQQPDVAMEVCPQRGGQRGGRQGVLPGDDGVVFINIRHCNIA